MIIILDHDLHLHDRYYPSPELEGRWFASKETIKALMGWAIPVYIERGHWVDKIEGIYQQPYANADFETIYPRFFGIRH